jgi:hypothetical protein
MKFFFHKDHKESEKLFIRLATACEGLIYGSETDAPVTPYAASSTDLKAPDIIIQHTGRNPGEGVEESPFADFFDRLTTIRDWYGDRETLRAKKFLELQKLLEEHLTELKVYRLGRIQIDIFVVGRDQNDLLMGVTTKAIET